MIVLHREFARGLLASARPGLPVRLHPLVAIGADDDLFGRQIELKFLETGG